MSQDRGTAGRQPSQAELRETARYAGERAALYRRKVLLGRGEPARLAELERVAAGAAARLRRSASPSQSTEEAT